MRGRVPTEEHRAATRLELFFDLCFVVSVAEASTSLHHALSVDELSQVWLYPIVFFAIWWAWMNFTWFASAYDTDDVPYRIAILVAMAGVLVLAAGVPRAFADNDFAVVTLGYGIMRVALVAQWLRAARDDPAHRRTALRFAVGVAVCMVGWALVLALPEDVRAVSWLVLVPAELLVPVWAERAAPTSWHPRHIAERYGLFTIIVLGESVLAATFAVQAALDAGEVTASVIGVGAGGLLIVFSMWWLYFSQPAEEVLGEARARFAATPSGGFIWGYGHYVVFAAGGAVGAGLALAVDQVTDHSELTARAAALAVAVPVALFVMSVWVLHHRDRPEVAQLLTYVTGAALVVVVAVVLPSVLAIGVALAALVVATAVVGREDDAPTPP